MKKANNKTNGNVTAIAQQASTVDPPDGWVLNDPQHGFMATDSTPAGRLVRLADVVRWLMDVRHLPCGAAVDALCVDLEASPATILYMVELGKFAAPLSDAHCFNAVTNLGYKPSRSFWEGEPDAPVASDFGRAGAFTYMRSAWGESAGPGLGNWYGQNLLEPLAIYLTKAAALWGYGVAEQSTAQQELRTFADLVTARNRVPGQVWTANMIAILRQEDLGRQGQLGARKKIGVDLNISASRIGDLLTNRPKLGRPGEASDWKVQSIK